MTLYSELGESLGMGTGGVYSAMSSVISMGNGINVPKKILYPAPRKAPCFTPHFFKSVGFNTECGVYLSLFLE